MIFSVYACLVDTLTRTSVLSGALEIKQTKKEQVIHYNNEGLNKITRVKMIIIIMVHGVIVISYYYRLKANNDNSVIRHGRFDTALLQIFQCSFLFQAFPVSFFLATSRSELCLCTLCDVTSNGLARLVKFSWPMKFLILI